MTIQSPLELRGNKNAINDFMLLVTEANIQIEKTSKDIKSGQIKNSSDILRILFSKESSAMFVALCGVISLFLSTKSSRRVTLTLYKDGKIKSIDAKAYPEKDLAKMLPQCQQLLVYDKATDKTCSTINPK